MPLLILLIFLGVPLLEIAVFIQAGHIFGLWPTLAAVVATAVAGVALLRAQGIAALNRARESVQRNEVPVAEVFTGVCLLLAGALLLTPGFVTDAVGFLLLVRPLRERLGRRLLEAILHSAKTRVWVDGEEVTSPGNGRHRPPRDAIDVDYTEVRPDSADDNGDRRRR